MGALRKIRIALLLAIISAGQMVLASSVSREFIESFTTTNYRSSSDMVWNTERGELHPPLFVDDYDAGSGATDLTFSVGDGRHGSFASTSDFEAYGVVVGTTIYLDTNTYPDLQFTYVSIPSSYTLTTAAGANPIVMRVLGDVTIDGSINCSGSGGTNGGSGGSTAVNSGGSGYCGGGAGGSSSSSGAAPGASNNGAAGGTLVTGGSAGPLASVNSGQGGGGGGAYVKTFSAAPDKADGTAGSAAAPGTGGAVGANHRDDAFVDDIDGAGSGGGGGSGYSVDSSSGGGGGGGGGQVRLYVAGNVTVNGSVLADGGIGGSVSGGLLAGGGGGGGGGSILIFAGKDIQNNGTIRAQAGTGGSAGGGTTSGGNGDYGRTWLVEKDGFASGTVEDPDTQLNSPGDVRYETGTNYTVQSSVIDLRNTNPKITSLPITTANLGGATLTYEVAFGSAPDAPSLSSFAAASTYLNTEPGRYAVFKIQIDNTGAVTPATVTSLSFNYDGFKQTEFEMVGACGAIKGAAPPPSSNSPVPISLWWLVFFLGPLQLVHWMRRKSVV